MTSAATIIGPGHGGPDPGNEHGGMVEAEYVFDLGCQAVRVCTAAGFETALSRGRDEDPSISERDQRTNGRLLLSLHTNAGIDAAGVIHPAWHGAHVFYCEDNGRTKQIAEDIEGALPAELRRRRGGVIAVPRDTTDWSRVAHVLYGYRADAVLIEFGYGTNPRDAAYLRASTTPDRLVAAIYAGVARAAQVYGR